MKKFKFILLAFLFAFVLVPAVALVSCNTAEEISGDGETTVPDVGESPEDHIAVRLYPDVPDSDFNGYVFTFITRTIDNPDWIDWDHRDIFAEEQTGDPINDAVYIRNRTVEAKYNFAVKEIVRNNAVGDVRKAVKAGDNTYDAALIHLNTELPALSQDGYLYNIMTMPYLDLTKPWWNQGCIRDLSIGGKLYAIQSDLTVLDNDATSAMIFNKKILQEFALEDPYELVKNGKWTLGKLSEMIKGVSQDLNGDGKMYIQDDRFGLITQEDSSLSFLYGAGERTVSKDKDDYPIPVFNNGRAISVMEFLTDLISDSDNVVRLHQYMNTLPIYEEQAKMMEEDRALFSWIRMRVVEKLRSMQTDFGILPIPKWEETQERYWTQMNSHTSDAVAIPKSNDNPDRTGIILEALTAESKYTLQPAYYDLNLYGKFTRDEESRDMLDIIFNTTMYDIGEVFNFGNFADTIIHYPSNKTYTYASTYEKLEKKIYIDIDKVMAKYADIDD